MELRLHLPSLAGTEKELIVIEYEVSRVRNKKQLTDKKVECD